MARQPRFAGLGPASARSSQAARGASRKVDTKPELILRRALWRRGLRYRTYRTDLPGTPDLVFGKSRVVVFVDGDFWHGRDWPARRVKLERGHNAAYWIRKIESNVDRDRDQDIRLRAAGWKVIRVWESDVYRNLESVIHGVELAVGRRRDYGGRGRTLGGLSPPPGPDDFR